MSNPQTTTKRVINPGFDGMDARRAGLPVDACPYEPSPQRTAWVVGWYIAAPEKDAESDMSKPETTAPLDLLAQRVAMAICRVSCQSGLCEGGGRCWDWMPALPEARAAITAMERCKWESLIPK